MCELNNKINKIRILFFISLMILSVHSVEINILNVLSDFKCKTKIMTNSVGSGHKVYVGTALKPYSYEAFYQKSTVIAYIVDEPRFEEIANSDALEIRMEIGQELGRNNHEMIIFGIQDLQDNEFHLISEFLRDIIKPHPDQRAIEIVTMGEGCFDQIYERLRKYEEISEIYNQTLQTVLRGAFSKMAFRSKRQDPSNIKEVRLFEHINCKRKYTNETRWPIFVKNGEYIPAPNINFKRIEHCILRRNKDTIAHILIISGKDYIRLTTANQQPVPWLEEIQKISDNMRKNNDILFIMGCFNFDWTEVGIVPHIIMTHSKLSKRSLFYVYQVFTAGIGMFDTFFHNPIKMDTRELKQSTNMELMEFIKKYHGEPIRKKTIEVFNLNVLNVTKYEIILSNGRYERLNHCFTNPYSNTKFAFIVIDSTEMNEQNVFSVAQTNPYVRSLQSNGFILFVIKLNNFKLYDLHIIPEWIESIRGIMPSNRIAVLGGGSCNTIYQLVSPDYQITYTLLNVAAALKEICQSFVTTADTKNIILANINVQDFLIQKIPMHTINGFYDPVVISEIDMITTTNNTKILFLIMNADKFINMIKAVPEWRPTLISDFRQSIANDYPLNKWSVYLVGFENFAKKDFHLFAEFVKFFTNDRRYPREFVYTYGDGIYQTMYVYRYRDTLPFFTATDMPMADTFNEFFDSIDVISALNGE